MLTVDDDIYTVPSTRDSEGVQTNCTAEIVLLEVQRIPSQILTAGIKI